jgi:hypothetical protein
MTALNPQEEMALAGVAVMFHDGHLDLFFTRNCSWRLRNFRDVGLGFSPLIFSGVFWL